MRGYLAGVAVTKQPDAGDAERPVKGVVLLPRMSLVQRTRVCVGEWVTAGNSWESVTSLIRPSVSPSRRESADNAVCKQT